MPADAATHNDDRDRERGDSDRAERGGSKQKGSASSKGTYHLFSLQFLDQFDSRIFVSAAKDLSHVPCKFYKVGGCTAGASCPFSHTAVEPGGQKETCTWFVKGNCKFGHKCALAHILPGQSMAMDRKNKKAAQTAAAAAAGTEKGKSGNKGAKREGAGAGGGGNRLPLLAGGATAPTRMLNTSGSSSTSGRPPMNMPLKATISPSAPAPPLQDTDFASFATLDEMETVHHPPTSTQQPDPTSLAEDLKNMDPSTEASNSALKTNSSAAAVPLPPSAPRPSNNPAVNDFGPIGSPPNYRPGQPTSPNRANGTTFSPGTSPRNHSHLGGTNLSSSPSNGMLSSSPFSAPGTQTHFMPSSYSAGAGIAASLGSGLAMMGGRRNRADAHEHGANSYSGLLSAQLSSSVSQQRPNMNGQRDDYDISIEYDEFSGARHKVDTAVEDEDLEDFLPSSLNDLLTPEERSRRMSRSNSGQPPAGVSHLRDAMASATIAAESVTGGPAGAAGSGNAALGHRYSRSVPAPTLLGDIKSIWSDSAAHPMPSSPPAHRGTPSTTYTSRLDPYGPGGPGDEMGLSMSMGSAGTASSIGMMSPSNASAAFLPGLHHHYLSAKAKQQAQQSQLGHGGVARAMRGASNPLFASNGGGNGGGSINGLANNYLQPLGGGNALGLPSSASNSTGFHTHTHGNTQTTYRTTPSPFDLTQTMHQHQHQQPHTSRPIPASNLVNQSHQVDDPLLAPHLLSPSARALQSHAPGQSLPQGLAAGYSRIHALPPLTNIASPPTGTSFGVGSSPGTAGLMGTTNNSNGHGEGPYGDWATSTQNIQHQQGGPIQSNTGGAGLDSMFSRLSYNAAARAGGPSSNPPPGLSRNVSGPRYTQPATGPLSPLSGPVVTRDDDDLFDMDR